jgi:uncharacterized protein YlxW (UPF0749 family)
MSTKKNAGDLRLHMAVKTMAILQGEINCNLEEIITKAKLLQKKEEEGEKENHLLLEMISDNLNKLTELFEQRKKLQNQIKNLEKILMDLFKK